MNVSRQFLKDFAYIANRYGWTPEDVEQAKADTRANPGLVNYWTVLADAHRNGYEQTAENRFIRLTDWCRQNGLADPFSNEEAMQ
ncbi:alanine racemase [Lacisediminimonas profundi]|uniref:alanine racemase n=1 Tax=Lacisediminimonas profundi TaxID=2603856 RepID=UPI00124BA957|nr:alanine racemase [Lacisediminimonas profundi]